MVRGADWIYLAQDRCKWSDIIKRVRNLSSFMRGREFVDQLGFC
jgi:hypothetical protein